MNSDLVFEPILPFGNIIDYFPIFLGALVYIACSILNYHSSRASYLKSVLAGENKIEDENRQEFWSNESTIKYIRLLRKKHLALWWVAAIFGTAITSIGVYYIISLGNIRDSSLMLFAFLFSFCIHRTIQVCFMMIAARKDNEELKKNISSDFYQVGFSRLAKLERLTYIVNIFLPFLGIIVFGWIILNFLSK
ncbi:TPA: hypothetical protein ACIVGF_002848 [Salmonella enterica subsp. enterica serovar 16:l,v:-]|nr:hypothetical protein [Salmonella enterica]